MPPRDANPAGENNGALDRMEALLRTLTAQVQTLQDKQDEMQAKLAGLDPQEARQQPQAAQQQRAQNASPSEQLDDVRQWRAYFTDDFSLQVLCQALTSRFVAGAPSQWQDELQGKLGNVMEWARSASMRTRSGGDIGEADFKVGHRLLQALRVDAAALRLGKDVRAARRAVATSQGDALEQTVAKLPDARRFSKARGQTQRLPPRKCRRCGQLHSGPWETHVCRQQSTEGPRAPEPVRL